MWIQLNHFNSKAPVYIVHLFPGIYFGALPAQYDPHFQYRLEQLLQEQAELNAHLHRRPSHFHGHSASISGSTTPSAAAAVSDNGSFVDKRTQQINVAFNVSPSTRIPVLLSVGEDRRLHRYDVYQATIHQGLKIQVRFEKLIVILLTSDYLFEIYEKLCIQLFEKSIVFVLLVYCF